MSRKIAVAAKGATFPIIAFMVFFFPSLTFSFFGKEGGKSERKKDQSSLTSIAEYKRDEEIIWM